LAEKIEALEELGIQLLVAQSLLHFIEKVELLHAAVN
jgi:hypothetical protein